MPNQKTPATAVGPAGALARPDWRAGGELTAPELRLEQKYRRQRIRRHLRLAHGWGVVCGLNVVAANGGEGWDLVICPGYGIGPCGDEIVAPSQVRFNLRDFLWTRPIGVSGRRAWIAIEAAEIPSAYQSAPGAACGCDCGDPGEETSRLAEGLEVVVSWAPPVLPQRGFDICRGGAPACPECPESCALPLASVVLPGLDELIDNSAIDNLGDR